VSPGLFFTLQTAIMIVSAVIFVRVARKFEREGRGAAEIAATA
jgi:hypothetical protein